MDVIWSDVDDSGVAHAPEPRTYTNEADLYAALEACGLAGWVEVVCTDPNSGQVIATMTRYPEGFTVHGGGQ